MFEFRCTAILLAKSENEFSIVEKLLESSFSNVSVIVCDRLVPVESH